MFWGISESLDLYFEYLNAQKVKGEISTGPNALNVGIETNVDEASEPDVDNNNHCGTAPLDQKDLNILIFGGADPRHVIKTIAKYYSHKSELQATPALNFYMIDGCIEIVARNILLLAIALEHPDSFNLLNKAHLFMDIYGNTLVRPSSYYYLVGKAKALLRMVTDDEQLKQLAPVINLEKLRYRERDGLENAYNFLLPKEGHIYNVEEYWSARCRQLLGERYDYREGVFDWDLNMTLKDREASQICSQEYRYWRECGIAFSFPEYEHCKPNKTLAAGLIRNGDKYHHRGYIGDIQTGPFCSFGLKCSEQSMHNSQHGDNDYRATDITERNLLELFHEIQSGTQYQHDAGISRKYGSVKLLMGERLTCNENDVNAAQTYDKPWIKINGIKINFLSADEIFQLQDPKGVWRDCFDVVFVGHNYFSFLREAFGKCLRESGLLVLETKLLTVERRDTINDFETKLTDYAKKLSLKTVINYQAINAKRSVLMFKKPTQPQVEVKDTEDN